METRTYRVIKEHISTYPDPIVLKKGERIVVGMEYDKDPEWEGWIWCENINGKKGWAPKQYLKIAGNTGIVRCDYSANELTVKVGEEIIVYKTENGWAWSRNSIGELGWVPLKNITKRVD
jgi:uncharacterized protein YraI